MEISQLNKQVYILIPAYKPDHLTLNLIHSLKTLKVDNIVVVRDGGGPEFDAIFDAIMEQGCHVCVHVKNQGKGAALKTGFDYIRTQDNGNLAGVVTADADGQHSPQDILRVSQALSDNSSRLILGTRTFDQTTPFRSKFGNILTREVFSLLTGSKISDTQTGLRGIPAEHLPAFSSLKGLGYEYEFNMLASTKKLGISILEVPIKTIYLDNNSSSHFNPLIDSVKIYLLLGRYALSGLASFGIDYGIFVICFSATSSLAFSSYFSRAISMIFNFTLNKKFVFHSNEKNSSSFIKYLATCAFSITLSYFALSLIKRYSQIPIYGPKIGIEFLLFFLNFYIQNKFIFYKNKEKR